ncbi:hypothetical protein FACS189459_6450 [Bacilli bacterium]|nr:hypothetical protein FACS189459_6450 [Bacilli bacterium]
MIINICANKCYKINIKYDGISYFGYVNKEFIGNFIDTKQLQLLARKDKKFYNPFGTSNKPAYISIGESIFNDYSKKIIEYLKDNNEEYFNGAKLENEIERDKLYEELFNKIEFNKEIDVAGLYELCE